MSLEEMWTGLAQHQPFADERGYGEAWAKMCAERTRDAAEAVEAASRTAVLAGARRAAYAAEAARRATAAEEASGAAVLAGATAWAEAAAAWAVVALDWIKKAEEQK